MTVMLLETMIGKNIYMSARVICLLIACGLPWEAVAEEDGFSIASSITRLQMRHTIDENDITSFTFSSFLQAKNKTYLLGILDYQMDQGRRNTNGRIEVNLGGPFSDSPLGWVVRGRSYYQEGSVAAAGLQLSFNELLGLGPVLKKSGITTFVQVLRNTSDPYFGDCEVLHYYSVDIVPKHIMLRGYNVFNNAGENGFVRNSWADLIYSLNDMFDVYYRINDVSQTNGYLGQRGVTQYLGVRTNWY
ncbi:MAG: hypothetical protein Q7U91_10675 [Sideroxyarcus sp.]|nr:hypothetical protein [Sideroxyarcus sp.]